MYNHISTKIWSGAENCYQIIFDIWNNSLLFSPGCGSNDSCCFLGLLWSLRGHYISWFNLHILCCLTIFERFRWLWHRCLYWIRYILKCPLLLFFTSIWLLSCKNVPVYLILEYFNFLRLRLNLFKQILFFLTLPEIDSSWAYNDQQHHNYRY